MILATTKSSSTNSKLLELTVKAAIGVKMYLIHVIYGKTFFMEAFLTLTLTNRDISTKVHETPKIMII